MNLKNIFSFSIYFFIWNSLSLREVGRSNEPSQRVIIKRNLRLDLIPIKLIRLIYINTT